MAAERKPRRPPATTPEARENQMIALAVDEAEKQILAGRASSQVIVHYLKLGTSRERLEQAKIEREVALLKAKEEYMVNDSGKEEMYSRALNAMRDYSGQESYEDYEEYNERDV